MTDTFDGLVSGCVDRYWRELDRYSKLAEFVAEKCKREVVESGSIRASVTWRAKDPDRFEAKLRRYLCNETEAAKFGTEEGVFAQFSDLAGVRVSTYVERDRDSVVEKLKTVFRGPAGSEPLIEKKDGKTGYRATHCQVVLHAADLKGRYANLEDLQCEVQVTSMLAHVWNEIEHDLVYKPLTGEPSEEERKWLKTLADATVAADSLVANLFDSRDKRLNLEKGVFADLYDFIARTRTRFPNASSFQDNAWQLFDALVRLGIKSPDELTKTFLSIPDYENKALEMVSQMNARPDVADLGLDDKSSDVLLMLVLDKFANEIVKMYPAGRGQGRPMRIRSIAVRFQWEKATPVKDAK